MVNVLRGAQDQQEGKRRGALVLHPAVVLAGCLPRSTVLVIRGRLLVVLKNRYWMFGRLAALGRCGARRGRRSRPRFIPKTL